MSYFWQRDDSQGSGNGQGGKARSIGLLRSLGWRTPPVIVVANTLFQYLTKAFPPAEWPNQPADLERIDRITDALLSQPFPRNLETELSAELDGFGQSATRFSVRSSFATEADARSLAAGVYESRINIGRASVAAAIRSVLASAVAPGAIAYAQHAGLDPFAGPFAVLVHPYIDGNAHGHAIRDTVGVSFMVLAGTLSREHRAAIESNLESLPEAATPCEVEWVTDQEGPVFLQWRPHVPPPPQPDWLGYDFLPSTEQPADWHWDAAHNPLPLSPAQAGLVQIVDDRCRIGIRQRVLGGYLFYRIDPDVPTVGPIDLCAFFDVLESDANVALKQLSDPPELESAIELLVRFYQPLFGMLGPAAKMARQDLLDFLAASGLQTFAPDLLLAVPSHATLRMQLFAEMQTVPGETRSAQALLDAIGDEASVWDVAEPTRRETMTWRRVALAESISSLKKNASRAEHARHAVLNAIDESKHEIFLIRLQMARDATAVGENDDALYARIVAPLRVALLHLGRTLCKRGHLDRPESIFFLPLPILRRLADGSMGGETIMSYVSQNQAEREHFLRAPPPLGRNARSERAGVSGIGTGGRTVGTVFHHEPGRFDYPDDAVLVAITLLPTELPLLRPIAIVTETGGLYGHVAAQARERGLPTVVGCIGACAHLTPGTRVIVDADAGVVIPVETY